MIERRRAKAEEVGSTIGRRIPEVSACGARTSSNIVSVFDVEEDGKNVESLDDAIDCWSKLENMLGRWM